MKLKLFKLSRIETKTKDENLKEPYNFDVVYFSHFKIQIFQETLDGEMTKRKVILLDNICNFL